jgi:hypothetical protein
MEHGMVRHTRLNEDRRALRIDARREPIDEQFADEFLDATGVRIICRQRMPVGDEKKALVLVLQRFPVLERSQPIAEVQEAARLHAAQHPFPFCRH